MRKITLLIPTILVLMTVWSFGETYEGFIVDGQHIVTAIVTSYGLWLVGYMEGQSE